MIYQHEIEENIRHHECDANGKLKLHSLFDRLQDAAAEHAAKLNVGMDELAEMRLIWVLSRLKIDLFEPLKLGDLLKVTTRPTGVQRIFAHRCYELGVDGRRKGIAGSFWLPVNTVSGRPVNAKKVLSADTLDVPEAEKFFSDMDKLPAVSSPVCVSYRVGAGDVDLNRHLNNAVYARWVTDLLGEKLNTFSPQVKEIQLNYLSPGQFGETIELRCEIGEEGRFLISGEKSGGIAVFQAAGRVLL